VSVVTVAPLILHTLAVDASIANVTGRLLEAVALTLKDPPLDQVGVGAAPKVIVWLERASTVCGDESVKPESLVARTTKVYSPAVVGVPDRTPVDPTSVSPDGTEPDASEYVMRLPVAAKVYEYTVPTVAAVALSAVKTGISAIDCDEEGTEYAVADPYWLVAVTPTRRNLPASEAPGEYVEEVAPAMLEHVLVSEASVQDCH
jgi:hypothetical protein